MNSVKRFLKKAFVLLIVFSFLGGTAYLVLRPKTKPCFNRVQDNGETGVDCGGFCDAVCPRPGKPDYVRDLSINWTKFVADGRNNYDFIVSISNENASWGISLMDYELSYYDEAGTLLGSKKGKTYAMPKGSKKTEPSTKYIIEEDVASNVRPARAEIKLSDQIWEEVTSAHDVDNLNEEVILISNTYFDMNRSLNVYNAGGISENTSVYDFDRVDFSVVLWGEGDELLAVGKTNQRTVRSGDGWGFSSLFTNFKGSISDVKRVDCRAETNVFDPNNFMKEYRGKE